MARAAHAHAVGVSWGYHAVAALELAGAEVIIDRFEQLLELAAAPA
jgi:phosphoglycolate phosphatase